MPRWCLTNCFWWATDSRLLAVCVVEDLGPWGRTHGLPGFVVFRKPIMVHLTLLFRYAADDHGGLRSAERSVTNLDRRSRDVRAVFSITPAVHVKTMASRRPEFHVVSGHTATLRSTI